MIIEKSQEMMRRSFERIMYRFKPVPTCRYRGHFGIYVHVPFCLSKCSFCPFYKEIYSSEGKSRYMEAILQEIGLTDFQGEALWLYFGGGTPNTLPIEDVLRIKNAIGEKANLHSVGIELLPALVTTDYLQKLRTGGFTKASIGIESLNEHTMRKTGRTLSEYTSILDAIGYARSIGLWINVDLMVGLPDHGKETFLADIIEVAELRPNQVTIYPFMALRGLTAKASMPASEQFSLIEEGHGILAEAGYSRKSVWIFAMGEDVYDSSRDELVDDYIGFGPTAFSTSQSWKIVNPELDPYVAMMKNGVKLGLVAPKTQAADDWRQFAQMIYDLKCHRQAALPFYINSYVGLLKLAGYSRKGRLTDKGRLFAHSIIKTVVESLPFPIQNPACVENWAEYESYKE